MKRLFSKNRWLGTILNVIGLTVSFTVFMIIMIQVLYDWRYDRNYPDSERIFRFEFTDDPSSPGVYNITICRPFIESVKGKIPEVEALGAYGYRKNSSAQWYKSDDREQIYNLLSSDLDTDMLKVFPFEFTEGDPAEFARPMSAIIAESVAELLWPDESPVGKTIVNRYNSSAEYRIVAVYRDFPRNSSVENGVLLQMGDDCLTHWNEWSFQCYMKLHNPDDAGKVAEMLRDKMLEALEIGPDSDMAKMLESGVRITNLHEAYFSRDIPGDKMGKGNRTTTGSLFAIGLILIVIAIINFINMATAAVPLSIKDINTRKVLGSGRAALIRRQLAEALFIAAAAFVLSVLALHLISTTSFTYYISGSLKVADNIPVILLGAAAAVCTSLIAGIFPAMYSTSFQPALVLKGSFSLSDKGKMFRSILVGFQFTASFVLMAAALYIQVQTSFMKSMDMGFNRDLVVEFGCGSLIGQKSGAFRQKLMENPHIKDVTFAGNWLVSTEKMGWGREFDGHRVQLDVLPVSVNFIDFFGMSIKEGRNFMPSDDLNPDGTFIMNEQTMLKYPFLKIGDRLSGHAEAPAEIVGIVSDFNFMPLQYGVDPIALYVFGANPWWPLQVVYARTDGADIAGTFRYIRDAIEEFNPAINGDDIYLEFLDETIGSMYQKEEKLNSLIAATAALSLLISLIGIFGMISFETQFRRKEIALRKVHGASVRSILHMLNRYYLIMTCICFAVSVPVSVLIMKAWVKGFAYQAPVPVWIFAASLAAVLAVTLLTVSLQTWKTANDNPVDSLRAE